MKVCLYQDPRGGGIGGAEYVATVLAEALRREGHVVDFAHHQGPGFLTRVSATFGMDMSTVQELALPAYPGRWETPDAPMWRQRAALRGWMRDVSAGYDLFVCSTHAPPPVCHAKAGLLYVHFPFFDRLANWPWNAGGGPRGWIRRQAYERWWRERLRSYSAVVANSEFTRRWTRSRWGVDPLVVYPPVAVFESPQPMLSKCDRIVVVGRFTPAKQQVELARAFAAGADRLPGWTLAYVGAVGEEPVEREYFAELGKAALPARVEIFADAPRELLHAELSRAKVFWHGMGIGAEKPEREEHFGIATVEAMSAGCVPIVPERGGQPEIVAHGQTGFLSKSFAEYVDYTAMLVADPMRAAQMASAAQQCAMKFAKSVFVRRMLGIIRQVAAE